MVMFVLPRKALAWSLAILMIATPLLAQQTMNDYLQGKLDGERSARGNPLWFLAGAGCGIFGAGAAYFIKPSPPVHALMGKPTEYVLGYTEGYQNKARNQNTMYACGGWLAFVVIYAAAGGFETTD